MHEPKAVRKVSYKGIKIWIVKSFPINNNVIFYLKTLLGNSNKRLLETWTFFLHTCMYVCMNGWICKLYKRCYTLKVDALYASYLNCWFISLFCIIFQKVYWNRSLLQTDFIKFIWCISSQYLNSVNYIDEHVFNKSFLFKTLPLDRLFVFLPLCTCYFD